MEVQIISAAVEVSELPRFPAAISPEKESPVSTSFDAGWTANPVLSLEDRKMVLSASGI